MNFRAAYGKLVLLFLLIFICSVAFAQPGDPGVDPDVPITGIEILLALGGALGIKKLFVRNKPKE